jgi:hypothetical protein
MIFATLQHHQRCFMANLLLYSELVAEAKLRVRVPLSRYDESTLLAQGVTQTMYGIVPGSGW